MKRSVGAALAAVLVVAVSASFSPDTSAADTPCHALLCEPPVKVVSDGYAYSYDRAGRYFLGTARFGTAGGATAASYDVVPVIDCGLRVTPPGAGELAPTDCPRAVCQVGAAVGRWVILFSRETAPDAVLAWTRGARRCAVVTAPIPLAAVEAAAAEHLARTVPAAVPVIQPGALTLVAFPTIVSTPDPGPTGFGITLPLPGLVAVTPTFGWTFTDPDGTTTPGTGAGTAFDGTAPSTPGYYLTHAFTTAGTGTVAVAETWTGTVTVDGVGPVALDPLVTTRAAQLIVRENRPVLVGH